MKISWYKDPIEDIAKSLRILSGRATLEEVRLMEEIDATFDLKAHTPFEEWGKIDEHRDKLMDELQKERLKRRQNNEQSNI